MNISRVIEALVSSIGGLEPWQLVWLFLLAVLVLAPYWLYRVLALYLKEMQQIRADQLRLLELQSGHAVAILDGVARTQANQLALLKRLDEAERKLLESMKTIEAAAAEVKELPELTR